MRSLFAAATLALALASSPSCADTCLASYYGEESGTHTASGARFVPLGMTAAHRSLPFGTRLRVTYGARSVVVVVNDRGPALWTRRCIDLSRGAAIALGMTHAGVGKVTFERI